MNKELDKKIQDFLNENREQYIKDLRGLISFNSVKTEPVGDKPYGLENAKVLDFMMSLCESAGLETKNYDYYCMDATYGEGEEVVAALAHLDIVPVGDGWTYDAFAGKMIGSCMYGRGVSDDKGPGLAALYALKALIHADVKLDRRIRLIYGCDEETGMSDMKYYLTKAEAPDYAFSPDTDFPVINAEKHLIKGTYSCKIPSESALISLEGGVAVNSVPSIAVAKISTDICPESNDKVKFILTGNTLEVTAYGTAAHASLPHEGDNAIAILVNALLDIMKEDDPAIPYLSSIATCMGDWDGSGLGIKCSDEASGGLTINLGIISYADNAISIRFDIRHPVTLDCQATIDKMKSALPGFELSDSDIEVHDGIYRPKDSFLVKTLMDVYHEFTGDDTPPQSMGGGTYARALPNAVAFGARFINSNSGGTHSIDEFCDIDELLAATRIYAHCFYNLANNK